MPALNFQARFAEAVEIGDKTQTIRRPRRDSRAHAKVGDTISLYTGMRSKSCRKLGEGRVVRTQQIVLGDDWSVLVDGRRLHAGSCGCAQCEGCDDYDNEFAKLDGFDGAVEMFEWFRDTHGLPFEGMLIRWDFRY